MPKITFRLRSYRPGSAGACYLSEALGELGHEVTRVKDDELLTSNTWVINWGDGSWIPHKAEGATGIKVFNPAKRICDCIEKVSFFQTMDMADVTIPAWTQSSSTALRWLNAGKTIYCRTHVEGRDGRGIVIATRPSELV